MSVLVLIRPRRYDGSICLNHIDVILVFGQVFFGKERTWDSYDNFRNEILRIVGFTLDDRSTFKKFLSRFRNVFLLTPLFKVSRILHIVNAFPKFSKILEGKVNLKIETLHLVKEDMGKRNVTNEPSHNAEYDEEKDGNSVIQPRHDWRGERCLDHANRNQQKDEGI